MTSHECLLIVLQLAWILLYCFIDKTQNCDLFVDMLTSTNIKIF